MYILTQTLLCRRSGALGITPPHPPCTHGSEMFAERWVMWLLSPHPTHCSLLPPFTPSPDPSAPCPHCQPQTTGTRRSVQNSLLYFFVRQTHWFLDHSRGWKPFTNLFIWKYKYKIILSTSVMWETPIHIVFYNRASESHTQRPERCLIYIDTYIYVYI